MTAALTLTESNLFQVLGDFLTLILPTSCGVVRGQDNRVAEPAGTDYVMMWPLLRPRLATNESSYNDVAFTGSVSAGVLTVSQMIAGTIATGLYVSGGTLAANSQIGTQLTGTPGGAGTYNITPAPQNVASTTMQAGGKAATQRTQVNVQLDVHGPASADNAQIITTLFRDIYATEQFSSSGFAVQVLYTNEPKQVPFMNAEQQYEERWIVEASLQINPTVTTQQQFAGALSVTLINTERAYPA